MNIKDYRPDKQAKETGLKNVMDLMCELVEDSDLSTEKKEEVIDILTTDSKNPPKTEDCKK